MSWENRLFFFFLLLSIINYYINSTIKHICTVRVALPPHNSSVTGFILSLGYFACSPLLCDVAGKCTKDALSLSQVSPRNVFCKCLKLHPVLQWHHTELLTPFRARALNMKKTPQHSWTHMLIGRFLDKWNHIFLACSSGTVWNEPRSSSTFER